MPTFIKTGYWDKLSKAPKGFLNLEELIASYVGSGLPGQVAFWGTSGLGGSSNLFWDATNNRLGIKSSSPTGNFEVKTSNDLGLLRNYNLDDMSAPIQAYRGNNGVVSFNTFVNNGTISLPTNVSSSGGITRLTGNIYIDGAYRAAARMEYITTSIPAINNIPTGIRWLTTDNSYSLNERAGITSNGNFQIGDSITTNRSSRLYVKSSGSTAATYTAQFHNSALNNALVIDDAGSVLVGSSVSNGNRFQVTGNGYFSGNVGLGVTPISTWNTNNSVIQLKNAGAIASATFGTSTFTWIGSNWYNDGTVDRQITNGRVALISVVNGGFFFNQTTTSGIAGDPVTFTTIFTLNSSGNAIFNGVGNFLIGTSTSSVYKLDVNGTARFSNTVTNTIGGFEHSSTSSTNSAFYTLLSSNIRFYVDANGRCKTTGNIVSDTNGTLSLNASAISQIDSTTKGFLPPRMTTAQKNLIATPAAGLVVYDTDLNKLCVFTTGWQTITSA